MSHTVPSLGRAEPEEGRRRQLIETTLDTLAEYGFVGTTLARIAARADISPALLVHHFGDKDRLLEAAFRSLAARLSVRRRRPPARGRNPAGAGAGGDRRQSGTGGVHAARRRRVAGVLGPGGARAAAAAGAGGISAAHAVQPAPRPARRDAGGRGAPPRRHDRGADRRRVAARGAVGMARGRQRGRARHGRRPRGPQFRPGKFRPGTAPHARPRPDRPRASATGSTAARCRAARCSSRATRRPARCWPRSRRPGRRRWSGRSRRRHGRSRPGRR